MLEPLHILCNDSIEHGYIHPMLWKSQLICPVYNKKGSKALAENYRPISLTSHIVKTFERVVRSKIVDHLENNELITDRQHGFRKGKKCLSEL